VTHAERLAHVTPLRDESRCINPQAVVSWRAVSPLNYPLSTWWVDAMDWRHGWPAYSIGWTALHPVRLA